DQLRSDVPTELAAVVAKMMAKDPDKRYQKPIEVAQALAGFVKAKAKPGSALSHPDRQSTSAASRHDTNVRGETTGMKPLQSVTQATAKAGDTQSRPEAFNTQTPAVQSAVLPRNGRGGHRRRIWPVLLAGAGTAA